MPSPKFPTHKLEAGQVKTQTVGSWELKQDQPYICVSITEELVKDVAKLPAQYSIAGEGQAVHN